MQGKGGTKVSPAWGTFFTLFAPARDNLEWLHTSCVARARWCLDRLDGRVDPFNCQQFRISNAVFLQDQSREKANQTKTADFEKCFRSEYVKQNKQKGMAEFK